MCKFESQKYVFIGQKRVIYHDIVQEIKFKHAVKSFRHIETFLSQKKAFLVAWSALSSLFWAEMSNYLWKVCVSCLAIPHPSNNLK